MIIERQTKQKITSGLQNQVLVYDCQINYYGNLATYNEDLFLASNL